jgi:hypothetical protein
MVYTLQWANGTVGGGGEGVVTVIVVFNALYQVTAFNVKPGWQI